MHAVTKIRPKPEGPNATATLANWNASLAALRYSRACRSFEIPDFESNPSFVSRALLEVSGDEVQEGEDSQCNSLFYDTVVILTDHGLKLNSDITGLFQILISQF